MTYRSQRPLEGYLLSTERLTLLSARLLHRELKAMAYCQVGKTHLKSCPQSNIYALKLEIRGQKYIPGKVQGEPVAFLSRPSILITVTGNAEMRASWSQVKCMKERPL